MCNNCPPTWSTHVDYESPLLNDMMCCACLDALDFSQPPASVYRFYDSHDRLLYVGKTGQGSRRFDQHAYDKDWWHQVSIATILHLESSEEALLAERLAIVNEAPYYNMQYGNYGQGPNMLSFRTHKAYEKAKW